MYVKYCKSVYSLFFTSDKNKRIDYHRLNFRSIERLNKFGTLILAITLAKRVGASDDGIVNNGVVFYRGRCLKCARAGDRQFRA